MCIDVCTGGGGLYVLFVLMCAREEEGLYVLYVLMCAWEEEGLCVLYVLMCAREEEGLYVLYVLGGLICVMCIDVCTGGGGAYDIYNKVLITYTVFIVHTLLCIVLICVLIVRTLLCMCCNMLIVVICL